MDFISYQALDGLDKSLIVLIKAFLGVAYHEYQKQKHLLGDLSFHDWIDKLADEFQESDDFSKD